MSALPDISPYLPAQASRNPMMNLTPAIQNAPVVQPFVPQRAIDYVKGQDGANALNLGPNSSTLALDADQNIVWVVATDQNGTKSIVKGYWLGEEYVPPKPVTMEDLMSEMQDMKNRMIKLEEDSSYGKRDRQYAGQTKSNGSDDPASLRTVQGSANGKPSRSAEQSGSKNEASV